MSRITALEETCSRIIYFCNKRFLKDGICVHSPIIKLGVQHNLLLTNNLLFLYAKRFGVDYARQLFDEMHHRDVVSWTGILSAYVKDGNHEEAHRFFHLMKLSAEKPNEFTFSNVLISCSASGNLVQGTKVHACLVKCGFDSNPILCSSLIELYSKWDLLVDAVKVFDGIENGDTVSWTAMISSFAQAGKWAQAACFFVRMMEKAVAPNEYTFVKLLAACSSLGINYAKMIHSQLIVWGVGLNLVLKTALVDAYAKCRKMDDALKILHRTSEQDVQLWTTVICNFTLNSNFEGAFSAFRDMGANNVVPNSYCYAGILNASSSARVSQFGKQIHKQVVMAGLEDDTSVGNALLDFYAKCSNDVDDFIRVFKGIKLPNVVSWTTLIVGLASHGFKDECYRAFLEMRYAGQQPNSLTLSSILQACGDETLKIHGFIVKTNAKSNGIIVGNALVEAYAGLGMVNCAVCLMKAMVNRTIITYTMLASKLNQIGYHKKTLEVISLMHEDDFQMDGFIISTCLSASANLGAKKTGEQLHCYSVVSGFIRWVSVTNGLVDLYGKCRSIKDAEKAFSEIRNPDVISWNSLMHSFALNGDATSTLSTLEDMRLSGAEPDSVTLLTVLFACNQQGLVDTGIEYFHSLREMYDIKAGLHHYNLLVDLLGRDGRLQEAVSILKSLSFVPDASIWKRLLVSCKLHRDVLLAEEVARQGLVLDPFDMEFHGLLAAVYDEVGRSDLGDNARSIVKDGGLKKSSICSLVANS